MSDAAFPMLESHATYTQNGDARAPRPSVGKGVAAILVDGGTKGQEMRAALLDPKQHNRLRIIGAVVFTVLAGEAVMMYMLSLTLNTKLDDVLLKKANQTSFESIIKISVIVTCLVVEILIVCKFVVAMLQRVRLAYDGIRWVLMTLMLVFLALPVMEWAKRFDCDPTCPKNGNTIAKWMLLWGIVSIVYWPIVLLVRSLRASKQLEKAAEEKPQNQTASSRPRLLAENQAPIVTLLYISRDLLAGIALLLSRTPIRERVDNETEDAWTEVLAFPVVSCGVATFLGFVSLISMGCPTALEKSGRKRDILFRALWNTGLPFVDVVVRLFVLMLIAFGASFADKAKYYPHDNTNPRLVSIWPRLTVIPIGVLAAAALSVCIRPALLATCAHSVVAHEVQARAEDADGKPTPQTIASKTPLVTPSFRQPLTQH
eukprot:Rhum_TRINITY_DN15450_c0_g1::Rhum_TRINITY_DN15450_c0_g1_i18::g.157965::m.157965